MQLSKVRNAHFIGIGGIGMSALARLFMHEGKQVSGSDVAPSDITKALTKEGAKFFDSQIARNITKDIEMVVYTEAMSKGHPEMLAARALGVPMVSYFEALGMAANRYYLVAVAGSHGKTTTTAMLVDIFEEAGLDPTAVVGSLRTKTESNYRAGKSKYMIVEACEYRRDFMHLQPDVLVVTNIEYEHVDYYKDLADVQSAFREFAEKVPEEGAVIANLGDDNVRPCIGGVKAKVFDYGRFVDPLLKLTQPGMHNQMNAAAAQAAAAFVGITPDVPKRALRRFAGTWRRFEYKGEINGAKVYDDYSHHPTEIRAAIAGARELYPDKRLTVVFQPHTYSRTHELFDDFVTELAKADRVILAPIYAAREANESGVTHTQIAEAIKKTNTNTRALNSFDEIVTDLKQTISDKDAVIIMGAGDITKVSEMLI